MNLDCVKINLQGAGGFSDWIMDLLKNNYRLSDKRKKLIAKRLEERIVEAKDLLKD